MILHETQSHTLLYTQFSALDYVKEEKREDD